MRYLVVLLICWLLSGKCVDSAFKDFVVEPEKEIEQFDNFIEADVHTENEQGLISLNDVEHDGIVDTELLVKALTQYAQRMGMDLQELIEMQSMDNHDGNDDEDETLNSVDDCSSTQDLSAWYQPSWWDVFFG